MQQKNTNRNMVRTLKHLILFLFLIGNNVSAQQVSNKPEREQWFQDLGLGMFIHWSLDAQLGTVISHSMSGASDDYLNRYVTELPQTFNPTSFHPEDWAVLAKLAGMKYVVFTSKHHNGFCMWNTKTTGFNSMNTPFKRDILKEVIDAFRKQGIAIGIYLSPEDFHYLYENHIPIGRMQLPMHFPKNNSGLMAIDKAQIKELLTNYGKIDILYFDGPAEGLKEYAWSIDPNVMVTRGQIKTPEQTIPKTPLPGPWESCFTMGTDWQYKPTNDPQKSGTEMINMLIETRAKGGNLLLNVGPKPNGEIQIEQEALLRELALWNFVNGESIHHSRGFNITNEKDIWFTRSGQDSTTVFAFVPGGDAWKYGDRKEMIINCLQGSDKTKVSVLGYGSELVEYREGFDAKVYVQPTQMGLLVSAVNGQRLYTNNKWPNPIVLKIENVHFINKQKKEKAKSKIDGAM